MDSLWNDSKLWITAAVTVLSALLGILGKRLFKEQDRLYDNDRKQDRKFDEIIEKIDKKFDEMNNKIEIEFKEIREETNNIHSIVSGHMQYHQGMDKRGK